MRLYIGNIIYITSNLVDDFSAIATYSANDSDSGIGKLSSNNPCTCISIASQIFFSASALVEPVAIQPGKSGEYAEYLLLAFSIATRKRYIFNSPFSIALALLCYLTYLEQGHLRMTRNRYSARFNRVFLFPTAFFCGNQIPTFGFKQLDNLTNFHFNLSSSMPSEFYIYSGGRMIKV